MMVTLKLVSQWLLLLSTLCFLDVTAADNDSPLTITQPPSGSEFIQCEELVVESISEVDGSVLEHTFSYHGRISWLTNAVLQFCENMSVVDLSACVEKVASAVSCHEIFADEHMLKDPKWRSKTVSRGVIVEPRNHPALTAAVNNVCNILHIPITVFCSVANLALVTELMRSVSCVDILVLLEHEDLRVRMPTAGGTEERIANMNHSNNDATTATGSAGTAADSLFDYNTLLLSDSLFWSRMGAMDSETILLFQTDSGICGGDDDGAADGNGVDTKRGRSLLETFSAHHYCGALIEDSEHGQLHVGTGGFSIRHVGMMRRLLAMNTDHSHHLHWEDILFSMWCHKDMYCSVCPVQLAHQFCLGTPGLAVEAIDPQWVKTYGLLAGAVKGRQHTDDSVAGIVDPVGSIAERVHSLSSASSSASASSTLSPWAFHQNWNSTHFYSLCPQNALIRALNLNL